MDPSRPYHPETEPESPAPAPVDADRALVLSCLAWPEWTSREAALSIGEPSHDFVLKLWNWIEASWLRRVSAVWTGESAGELPDRQTARERLRAMHVAASRLDVDRVHPSWLVRALREETPAVASIAARHGPDATRAVARRALGGSGANANATSHVRAEVVAWVLSLWTERLVGGRSETAADPPEIVAITQLSRLEALRLFRLWGFSKLALAGAHPQRKRPRPREIERRKWIEAETAREPGSLRAMAQADVQAQAKSTALLPRKMALLGVLGLARLCKDSDPFRLRWALQHLPYTIAKHIRSTIPKKVDRKLYHEAHEALLLKLAWRRLNLEHRIKRPWPGSEVGQAQV